MEYGFLCLLLMQKNAKKQVKPGSVINQPFLMEACILVRWQYHYADGILSL